LPPNKRGLRDRGRGCIGRTPYIISKDTGFDPLIQHLKSKKVRVCRSRDVTNIRSMKAATTTSAAERLADVIADLRKRGTARPRTIKTLSSTINSLFQNKLSEQELALLLQALQTQGFISIDDKKVSYPLPTQNSPST
jgi:hypothetical protein